MAFLYLHIPPVQRGASLEEDTKACDGAWAAGKLEPGNGCGEKAFSWRMIDRRPRWVLRVASPVRRRYRRRRGSRRRTNYKGSRQNLNLTPGQSARKMAPVATGGDSNGCGRFHWQCPVQATQEFTNLAGRLSPALRCLTGPESETSYHDIFSRLGPLDKTPVIPSTGVNCQSQERTRVPRSSFFSRASKPVSTKTSLPPVLKLTASECVRNHDACNHGRDSPNSCCSKVMPKSHCMCECIGNFGLASLLRESTGRAPLISNPPPR